MDHRTALQLLQLTGPAEPAEVKAAYRRRARTLHPDAGGDVEAFRRIQAAYEALRLGTDEIAGGPPPQEHAPAVAARWWEGPGLWHEEPVDTSALDLTTPVPDQGIVAADVALLARLVLQLPDAPWRLASRGPGAWLNRAAGMLDGDFFSGITVQPAEEPPRPGHDVVVALRAPGGRGRRVAGRASLPPGWVRSRGSEVVVLERRLRPSRDDTDTAVRVARAADELCDALAWPLGEWTLVRGV